MDTVCHYQSPLGGITIAADGHALTGLWFDGQRYFPEALAADCGEKGALPESREEGISPVLRQAVRWLDLYFGGSDPGFTPPLAPRGTAFRRAVWRILLSVPYGQTVTYGQIAAILAREWGEGTVSARSVGGAVGRNPISLLIPCHRVVGADGSLTGYAGGLRRKQALLIMENPENAGLSLPKGGGRA